MFHVERKQNKSSLICPVCGSKSVEHKMKVTDHFLSKEVFSLISCLGCGVIFTAPQPTPAEIGSYYGSEKYISHNNSSRGLFDKIYQWVRRYTIQKKVKLISRYKSKGSMLDIGCGTGHLLDGFRKRGWNTVGIEPNPMALKFAIEELNLEVHGEETLLKFPNQCFDVVSMWHVLEHVHDVHERLDQVFRILKHDGLAVIAIPNPLSYDAQYYQSHWAAWDVPRHLYHFSPQAFLTLAAQHRFELLKVYPMIFDAYYVSLLSESYKNQNKRPLKALISGWRSNRAACSANPGNYSSLIYLLRKSQ